jgi:hypothetical protein
MKLQSMLPAFMFAAASALSYSAYAATETGNTQAAAPVVKKAKPHSHVTDKTGMPQHVPSAAVSDKPGIDKDKSKHFHPRDAK